MKIFCSERDDGMPLLHLDAENHSDKDVLERLNQEIQHALDTARMTSLAGNFNACGSLRDCDHRLTNLTVDLLLGVHPNDVGYIRRGMHGIFNRTDDDKACRIVQGE